MKKNEVKVGGEFIAKVSGKLVQVRIDRENPHGGWDSTNMVTKKSVRIMSAQRLRARAGVAPRKPVMSETAAREVTKAVTRATGSALAEEKLSEGAKKALAGARAKAAAPDAALDADVAAAKNARAEKKAGKEKGERKPSLLTLAAEVLREAGTPMDCKTMVEKVLAKGSWKTSGKTPAATLYSAILREIGKVGDKARFRKTDRGHFEAVANS
jgi:hypothetical protein